MSLFRLLVAVLGLCMASTRAETCRPQNAPCSCKGLAGVITIGSSQTKGNPMEAKPGNGFVAYDNCLSASSTLRQTSFPDLDPTASFPPDEFCANLMNDAQFGYQEAGRLDLCLTADSDGGPTMCVCEQIPGGDGTPPRLVTLFFGDPIPCGPCTPAAGPAGGGGGGGGGFMMPLPPGSLESQLPNQLADMTHNSIEQQPWFQRNNMSLADAINGTFSPMGGTETNEADSAVSGVAQQGSAPSFGASQVSTKSEAAGLQNQNTQEEPASLQVGNPADEPAALHSAANGRIRVATSLLGLVIALSGLRGYTA